MTSQASVRIKPSVLSQMIVLHILAKKGNLQVTFQTMSDWPISTAENSVKKKLQSISELAFHSAVDA